MRLALGLGDIGRHWARVDGAFLVHRVLVASLGAHWLLPTFVSHRHDLRSAFASQRRLLSLLDRISTMHAGSYGGAGGRSGEAGGAWRRTAYLPCL